MSRSELRQCTYEIAENFMSPICYFHKWVEKRNEKYGETPHALLENKEGKMFSVEFYLVKFIENT